LIEIIDKKDEQALNNYIERIKQNIK
jgi:hypothetical protein